MCEFVRVRWGVGVGSLLNETDVAANMTSAGCAQITLQLYYECSQLHIGAHFLQRRQKLAKSYYPLPLQNQAIMKKLRFVGRQLSKYWGRKHNSINVFIFLLSHDFMFFISLLYFSSPLPLTILPPQYPEWQILDSGCARIRPVHDKGRQHTTTVHYWKWCICKFLWLEGYCCWLAQTLRQLHRIQHSTRQVDYKEFRKKWQWVVLRVSWHSPQVT